MSYEAPFAGLKIVDLSQGIAGPYCAGLLAQNGADVIKIEPVGGGDWSRTLGQVYGDNTAYTIPANIGKRSVALDLKLADGKAALWRIIQDADVFIEGFRPGVIGRLGFGYAAVAAVAPRILYVSVSGFGQTGPFAERPAMDPVLQAFTGLTIENRGEDGIPHRVPVIPIDMMTAMYAFQAVSAALYARRDQATGKFIEVSLMQAAALLQGVRMMASHLEGGEILAGAAPSGIFQCADGWINITVVRPFEWEAFCAAIGRADLPADNRFRERDDRITNAETLFSIIRPIVAALTNAQLRDRLTPARIMHERLNTYADFLAHEHTRATGLIAWLGQPGVPQKVPLANLPGTPPLVDGTARAHAPVLGEHTEQVLAEHGYGIQQIRDLAAAGAIGLRQTRAPATQIA